MKKQIKINGMVYTFKEYKNKRDTVLPAKCQGQYLRLPQEAIFTDTDGNEVGFSMNHPALQEAKDVKKPKSKKFKRPRKSKKNNRHARRND